MQPDILFTKIFNSIDKISTSLKDIDNILDTNMFQAQPRVLRQGKIIDVDPNLSSQAHEIFQSPKNTLNNDEDSLSEEIADMLSAQKSQNSNSTGAIPKGTNNLDNLSQPCEIKGIIITHYPNLNRI